MNFWNWIDDPRSSSKIKIMVKVQYTLSRSIRLARELGSSLGERPEIALPALLWKIFFRMGILTQIALSLHTAVEPQISAFLFGPLTDSLPSHPSW